MEKKMRKILSFVVLFWLLTGVSFADSINIRANPTLLSDIRDEYNFYCNNSACDELLNTIDSGVRSSRAWKEIEALDKLMSVYDYLTDEHVDLKEIASREITRVHAKLARQAEKDKDYEETLVWANQMFYVNKNSPDGYYYKARASFHLWDFEKVLDYYDEAIYYTENSEIAKSVKEEKAEAAEKIKLAEKAKIEEAKELEEATKTEEKKEEKKEEKVETTEEKETVKEETKTVEEDSDKVKEIKIKTEFAFDLIKKIVNKDKNSEAIFKGLHLELGKVAPKYDEDKQIMIAHLRDLIIAELER